MFRFVLTRLVGPTAMEPIVPSMGANGAKEALLKMGQKPDLDKDSITRKTIVVSVGSNGIVWTHHTGIMVPVSAVKLIRGIGAHMVKFELGSRECWVLNSITQSKIVVLVARLVYPVHRQLASSVEVVAAQLDA